MKDIHEGQENGETRRGLLAYALWGVAVLGVAVVLYVIAAQVIKPNGQPDLKALARGDMAKLAVIARGPPPPDTPILDAQGRTLRLADLKAPVVVVNLWATWCAPCVREMPTLAALQAAYPGRVLVAPISMDKADDREKARAFIAQHPPLRFYQDVRLALPFALSPPAEGFPTTVIYDASGHERARLAGPADWNGPDARAVIEALIDKR
jgi:thiol-disulfide isomerase/thioredoxin